MKASKNIISLSRNYAEVALLSFFHSQRGFTELFPRLASLIKNS